MRTRLKTYTSFGVLAMMLFQIMIPFQVSAASNDEVIYPLKKISKLECRFDDYDTLSSSCKQSLPILETKDYNKYAKQNGGYNDFTRIYTVLWGSSYKYGWDVGNGGHLGTDIATAKGTPVYSIADGKVIKAGNDVGWGKHVSIEHTIRGKKIISNYAHLSDIKVSIGDRVDVGDKVGEVGSTGNSTGNHLHFQIDLPYTFHPYYYDWNTCPYSFYEISESDKCFDDLTSHTLDPLKFLETNGAILDKIEVIEETTSSDSKTQNSGYDYSIFNVTISPEGDGTKTEIKEVQRIYKDLGYYDGKISGKYRDLEDALIDYQIDREVIASKSDLGAGWFGPKTRAQTKDDYRNYLKSGEVLVEKDTETADQQSVVRKVGDSKDVVEKVSRENLMTREEIEAMEVQEFLDIYKIDFSESISQIKEGQTKTTLIEVKNAKGRGYKGSTPGNVTFEYDTSKISVFPEKFYHFSDGEREIYITGKSDGHTTLKVKIGDVIIKEFSISVGEVGKIPQGNSASIYIDKSSVLGDIKTAVVVMKDQYGNRLVKSRYEGNFEMQSHDNIEYCVKRGTIQDIKSLYKRKCLPNEYTQDLIFNYDDTVGGILIFDYRVLDTQSAKIELKSLDNNGVIATKTIKTQVPKGLDKSYTYFDEVIDSLSLGITDGIRNDYFLKDKELSELDAKNWIGNTLKQIDADNKSEKIQKLKEERVSKYTYMTREDFLKMAAEYLGDVSSSGAAREYKDLPEDSEILVASLVGSEYQWKDTFGEDYFQPDKKLSRGEAAYLLMQVLKKQGNSYLAVR